MQHDTRGNVVFNSSSDAGGTNIQHQKINYYQQQHIPHVYNPNI